MFEIVNYINKPRYPTCISANLTYNTRSPGKWPNERRICKTLSFRGANKNKAK